MSKIAEAGTYEVILDNCHWESYEHGMVAVLTGRNDSNEEITTYLYASTNVRQKGKKKGMQEREIVFETLKNIGMPEDDPSKIFELDGKKAEFVCDFDDYTGENVLKVKFVNRARIKAEKKAVMDFFADMEGVTKTQTASTSIDVDDDIPFD